VRQLEGEKAELEAQLVEFARAAAAREKSLEEQLREGAAREADLVAAVEKMVSAGFRVNPQLEADKAELEARLDELTQAAAAREKALREQLKEGAAREAVADKMASTFRALLAERGAAAETEEAASVAAKEVVEEEEEGEAVAEVEEDEGGPRTTLTTKECHKCGLSKTWKGFSTNVWKSAGACSPICKQCNQTPPEPARRCASCGLSKESTEYRQNQWYNCGERRRCVSSLRRS